MFNILLGGVIYSDKYNSPAAVGMQLSIILSYYIEFDLTKYFLLPLSLRSLIKPLTNLPL